MKDYRSEIRRLTIAMNKMDGLYYKAARKLGVKDNVLLLLYALDDGETHTQKQICDQWLISKTTLNTVVKECADNGYVSLVHNDHSKEKLIILTEKGHKYTKVLMEKIYAAEDKAMSHILSLFNNDFITAIEKFSECLQNTFANEELI